jgi:hypothetical protein
VLTTNQEYLFIYISPNPRIPNSFQPTLYVVYKKTLTFATFSDKSESKQKKKKQSPGHNPGLTVARKSITEPLTSSPE